MGISGLIGGGASDALDEVIVQALAKKRFEEQMRAQQADEASKQQQLAQQATQFTQRMGEDARQFDATNAQGARRLDQGDRGMGIDEQKLGEALRQGAFERDFSQQGRDRQWGAQDAIITDPAMPKAIQGLMRVGKSGASVSARPDDLDPNAAADREIRINRERERAQADFSERPGGRGGGAGAGVVLGATPAMETAQDVQRIARALKGHRGFAGAFGVVDAALPTMRQDTADAETLRNTLSSLLTMENMGKMKGVLSDADMKMIREASTTINARMSEPAARAELDRLDQLMGKVVAGQGQVSPLPSHGDAAPGPTIRYERVHGKLVRVGG